MKKLCIRLLLVFSLFVANSLYAQENTVEGKVLDAETNEPLIGVSIVIKNTTTGAATDFDGQFSINVKGGATLVFTSIGYETKEMTMVGNENDITILLKPDLSQLDEVVIVGYGTQKKVNLTGSISTIKSEEIVQNSTANVSSALSGRLAGVITVQSSGEPGSDASTIRIRGLSSLNGSSPLILVDGIPRSLNNVNANDIESISVLKDAAASAIYGMRAANGVVLITTKRGKGKTTLSVNMYSGVQTPTRTPDFLDSYNYGLLLNEANANDGQPRAYTDAELQKFYEGTDPDRYPNTDWIDEALKSNSLMHSVDISASGSDKEEKVRYFTSLGYLYQDALFDNNDFDRFNFRSNLDIKINESIKLTTDFSGSLESTNRPGTGASTIFSNLMRNPPVRVNQFSNGGYSRYSQQPLVDSGTSATQEFEFQSKIALRIDFPFLEGLNLTTQVAYDRATYRNKSFGVPSTFTTFNSADGTFGLSTPSVRGEKASLGETQGQGYKLVTEGILGYNKTVNKHDFGAKLIYSRTYTQNNFLSGGISNILGTSVPFFKAGDAETRSLSNSTGESAILGYAGRFTYAYDNKYLFEFNGRYDGSYKFSNDAKFDFFPSYSAAWRVSQEDFLQDSNTISNLKLRFSYGELGSDVGVGPFRYLEFFEFGGAFIDNSTVVPTIQSSGLADPSTTWEKAKTYNFGLELGLWNNALTIETDVYSKRTSDILTSRFLQVPDTFGATLPLENIGIVDNKGYEIVISHNGGVGKDFNYFADFNFSQSKNKIIERAESPDVDPLRKQTGRPIGTRFGFIADGLFLTQQEIDDLNTASPDGIYQKQSPQPGDIRYRDITGDGKVDDKDRTVMGKGSVPEITFGLNLGFTYKQFDFSALFQGAANFDMYLSNEASWAFFNGGKVFGKHLDRAQIGADGNVINTNATYPKLSLNNNAVNERTSSYWIEAGDYIRFKNVEIGYTLPEKVMNKMGVHRLRVYFNGRNLTTWSKIKHLDPENPNQRGWFYPQQKVFNLGINLEF